MFDEELARYTKRKKRILTGILAIVGILAIAITVFFTAYITDCQIVGSQYSEEQEIEDKLFSTPMEQRFFYQLFRKITNTQKSIDGIAEYQIEFSLDLSVKVTITENPIVGAVQWNDHLYYFDRYGYVLARDIEVSDMVPAVDGSSFQNVALYTHLESENSDMAGDILQLTQLLTDNGISADAVSYDGQMQAVVTLGDVKVSLGTRDNMTDKIAELCAIIESGGLSGLKGTLHLENCEDGSTGSYIFDRE